jgi:preprotein translocase subunit SecA
MLDRIKHDTVVLLQRLQVRTEEEIEREERERQARLQRQMQALHAPPPAIGAAPEPEPPEAGDGPRPQPPGVAAAPFVREDRKVGRNEPCPCGSGKKYKHCHGALQQAGN